VLPVEPLLQQVLPQGLVLVLVLLQLQELLQEQELVLALAQQLQLVHLVQVLQTYSSS
jgi:hypothetical protein